MKYSPFLNARDETSAILLSSPGMLRVVSGDDLDASTRRPMRRSNRAAGIDLDVRNLFAQLTAEVLSQYVPTCLY